MVLLPRKVCLGLEPEPLCQLSPKSYSVLASDLLYVRGAEGLFPSTALSVSYSSCQVFLLSLSAFLLCYGTAKTIKRRKSTSTWQVVSSYSDDKNDLPYTTLFWTWHLSKTSSHTYFSSINVSHPTDVLLVLLRVTSETIIDLLSTGSAYHVNGAFRASLSPIILFLHLKHHYKIT